MEGCAPPLDPAGTGRTGSGRTERAPAAGDISATDARITDASGRRKRSRASGDDIDGRSDSEDEKETLDTRAIRKKPRRDNENGAATKEKEVAHPRAESEEEGECVSDPDIAYNACIVCGRDMGDENPRQLCCKTYCGAPYRFRRKGNAPPSPDIADTPA